MRKPPKGIIWPQDWAAVAFLPISSVEQKEGNSYVNDAEASMVDTVLAGVLNCGDVKPAEIGVITPYAAQARMLRRRFGCPPPGRRQDNTPLVGHAAERKSSSSFPLSVRI